MARVVSHHIENYLIVQHSLIAFIHILNEIPFFRQLTRQKNQFKFQRLNH